MITGLCLTLVSLTRPDPDLWIDFLAWGQTCLITTKLSDDVHSWLKLATTPRSALPAPLEGCRKGPLAGEDPDLAATLSPSVPCLFGSSWFLLHPDIILVDLPASLTCFHSTKSRKRNATCILIWRGNRGRKKLRYKLKLELFFIRYLKHVLPSTSCWRWQYYQPQCKVAAKDIQGVIWRGSCPSSLSPENNKSWLTRVEARGIRL